MIHSQLHPRTLEILKNPEALLAQDISILHNDISRFPYMQSLQALRLKGIHIYEPEKIELFAGLAAAHSADKKSLYTFIHHKKEKIIMPEQAAEGIINEPTGTTLNDNPSLKNDLIESEPISHSYSQIPMQENRKQNTGNTQSLEEPLLHHAESVGKSDPIDTVFKNEMVTSAMEEKVTEANSTIDIIKVEEELSPPKIEAESVELSFQEDTEHKTKITLSPSTDSLAAPLESNNLYQKMESEMERLIREVEEKMRGKTVLSVPKPEITIDNPALNDLPKQIKVSDKAMEAPISTPISAPKYSNVNSFVNTWENWLQIHPVSSETKEINVVPPSTESTKSEIVEIQQEILQSKTIAIPESNISENPVNSKEIAIEQFLENNPKISKYKEDLPVQAGRDSTRDISHLMTETLARIYREQKLYTKAIAGYEILIQKNPDFKEKYAAQIAEIKALRMMKPTEN